MLYDVIIEENIPVHNEEVVHARKGLRHGWLRPGHGDGSRSCLLGSESQLKSSGRLESCKTHPSGVESANAGWLLLLL